MRKVKKLLGLLLAAVMVLAMGVPTFAASGDYSIKINDESSGHTYVAYQVFKGTVSDNGQTLSNVEWGDGVNGEALLAALKGPEGTPTAYQTCTSAAGVAKVLEGYDDDSQAIKEFSDIVGQHLSETTSGTLSAYDEASKSYTISGLAAGYYFIKDADTVAETDAYTDFILKLTNDETITRKADVPTSEKKVDDKNDSNTSEDGESWQDSADYDIGDKVPYQLKAELPNNVSEYKTYTLRFIDTMSVGLTYDTNSAELFVNGISAGKLEPDIADYSGDDDRYTGGTVLTWDFSNIKAAPYNAGDNAVITIKYTATLNGNAVMGSAGNPNKMHIEFSNNPNGDGMGETKDDTNIVFTYKVVVNKVDENKTPLAGAQFKLEKKRADGSWIEITRVTLSENQATFTFTGLDDGDYKLSETKTPDGYNDIADIEFTITAEHDILSDDPRLTSLNGNTTTGEITFTPNTSDGSLTTEVENKSGSTLPETGGMGTTIFYVLGAILVLGAGGLLIARRRTDSEK